MPAIRCRKIKHRIDKSKTNPPINKYETVAVDNVLDGALYLLPDVGASEMNETFITTTDGIITDGYGFHGEGAKVKLGVGTAE